ncbi:hypothetical protein [Pseudarthrobacter sp. DSP2-3-2b1]|uniref:hypothetical protein n=1 Tax=Pseudarthrobacter sp. DSP2-3-2b1 TaxID=2804661 RepID=UPI003CEB948E
MSSATGPSTEAPRPDRADSNWLDFVDFGDEVSEAGHAFTSEASIVITSGKEAGFRGLPDGADNIVVGNPGESGRITLPLSPAATRLADLRFTMAVDPLLQNYLTVKFWGGDSSPYKTLVLVNGEQATYRNVGDYEPINVGTRGGLPGRFFHSTAALPFSSTMGQRNVEITLRTYVLSYRTLAGQTGFEKATDVSRRFFSAGTHTSAALPPSTLMAQTAPAAEGAGLLAASKPERATAEEEAAMIADFRQWQVDHFRALESRADAGEPMPISRYDDDLRFYAESLLMDWSPAATTEHKRNGLRRIFETIDHYTREYYGNVLLLGTGGHQSDWGGYYAALGEALYILENLIADQEVCGPDEFSSFLDEPFTTGSMQSTTSLADAGWDGRPLTRRSAWERVLKANFDFARSRLSYIYNQVMYTYEGAWKAHEGLRVIGSPFYQGRGRSHRIVREFLGIEPFLGEEVLLAPDGAGLDVHHSLFHHDGNAEYTDDYIQVIMKGLAISKLDADGNQVRRMPYGPHYYGLTIAGLVRENGYVGVYGEATNYFPCWFFRTLGHVGDEGLNDDILKVALKNLHARGFTRYQGRTADGRRTMFMEQVVDDRNSDYPGRPAYGTDEESGAALRYASLEEFMARNPERYSGDDWADYREYAREATGYAQQQLLDGQFFGSFHRRWTDRKLKYDLRILETFNYVTGGRAAVLGAAGAGRVLPHSHLSMLTAEEQQKLGMAPGWDNTTFAWVDIDNLLVSARDGDTHVFANLLQRNTGLSGASRAHIQYNGTEQLLQFQADAETPHSYVTIRGATREEYRQKACDEVIEGRPFALTGELLPVTAHPGVGEIQRDNFIEDNPYSAYPELVTAHLGEYFIAINTTRTDYGNRRTFTVNLPPRNGDGPVLDLITGLWLPTPDHQLTLQPLTAVVLKTGEERGDRPAAPGRIPALIATPAAGKIGLSWKPVAGANGYTVYRKVGANGPEIVANDVAGTATIICVGHDEAAYTVAATSPHGSGPASRPVRAATLPGSDGPRLAPALIGSAADAAVFSSAGTYRFTEVTAGGFAGGDDANLYLRGQRDSLAAATDLADGSVQLTARVASASATAGILLRENLTDHARYIFFGSNDEGCLVLRTRSLDSREDYGAGNPGDDAGGGRTRSPSVRSLGDLRLEAWPWLRLQRDAVGHRVTALVSADGERWQRAAQDILPMPEVVHAGACTTSDALFENLDVISLEPDIPVLTAASSGTSVELAWTKPSAVTCFDLYGVKGGTACLLAQDLYQTTHVLPASQFQRFKVIGKGPDGPSVTSGEVSL